MTLTTPLVADAVVRLGVPVGVAPAGIEATTLDFVRGPALPVTHVGSVDIFLEAIDQVDARTDSEQPVLVIDNQGRRDEACIGDLVAVEARAARIAAIAIWGLHRDRSEIEQLAYPIFSYGYFPFGPRRLDTRPPGAIGTAYFGPHLVTDQQMVVADSNGVLFVPADSWPHIAETAREIQRTEARQISMLNTGATLRDQLAIAAYVKSRSDDPSLTFRQHLRARHGAVEE